MQLYVPSCVNRSHFENARYYDGFVYSRSHARTKELVNAGRAVNYCFINVSHSRLLFNRLTYKRVHLHNNFLRFAKGKYYGFLLFTRFGISGRKWISHSLFQVISRHIKAWVCFICNSLTKRSMPVRGIREYNIQQQFCKDIINMGKCFYFLI